MRPALGYIRVSTEDQAREERTSLAQQRAALVTLAAVLEATLGQVFEDAGASGGYADTRPGFLALLAYCRAHPRPATDRGLVLVLNDSRWGRFPDPEEATYWRFALKRAGWLVRFVEGDETQDPMVRTLVRGIHSSQSAAYREAIQANARRGARGTAAQGYWGNEAPIGYRRAVVTPAHEILRVLDRGQRKASTERVRLTPGPDEEVALIRWLFARYATGTVSCYSLAKEAAARWPAKRWSNVVLRHLLKNPAYVGDVVWMRRPHDPELRRQVAERDPAQWVITRDAHPALVSRDLFARVAALLPRNQRRVRITAGGYPLSGLLRCAHCGDHYIGAGGPKGPPEDPDRFRFYRHASASNSNRHPDTPLPECPDLRTILSRRLVEPAVATAIGEALRQPAGQLAIRRAVDAALGSLSGRAAAQASRARAKERARKEAEIRRLVDLAAAGVFTNIEISKFVNQARARLEALAAEEQRATFAAKRSAGMAAERDRIVARALRYREEWEQCTAAERRAFMEPWIQSATVDRVAGELLLTLNPLPSSLVSGHSPGPTSRDHGLICRIPLPRPLRRQVAGGSS